jgi:hypothetical protein
VLACYGALDRRVPGRSPGWVREASDLGPEHLFHKSSLLTTLWFDRKFRWTDH